MGLRDTFARAFPSISQLHLRPAAGIYFLSISSASRCVVAAKFATIVNAVENKLTSLGAPRLRYRELRQFFYLAGAARRIFRPPVRGLVDRFYSGVSRYTTSGFLRIKLGEALEKARRRAAHL